MAQHDLVVLNETAKQLQAVQSGDTGRFNGDLTITGDLTVEGAGSQAFDEIIEGTQVIDVTNTEAFLVRKNADGGDVFVVDTTNKRAGLGVTPSTHKFEIEGISNTNLTALRLHNVHGQGVTQGQVDLDFDVTNSVGGIARARIRSEETTSDSNYSELSFWTSDTTSTEPTKRMVIDENGNVGIGTTSPDEKLTVSGKTKASEFRASLGSGAKGYEFAASGSGAGVANMFCPSGYTIGFGTNNTERMRIDSSGNVGIGTTDTTIYNDTNDEYGFMAGPSGQIQLSANNATMLYLNRQNGDGDIIDFRTDGTNVGSIGTFDDGGYSILHLDSGSTSGYVQVNDLVQFINTNWSSIKRLRPKIDNDTDLGDSATRFNDIFATNSTIQTSDERMKDNIATSSLGLNFVNQLNPVEYKWKDYDYEEQISPAVEAQEEVLWADGDELPEGVEVGDIKTEAVEAKDAEFETKTKTFSRKHYGLIAQEVEQVLSDNDINTNDFAPLVYDEESDRYGMRYGEMVGILIKAVQELSAKVESLKKQIN